MPFFFHDRKPKRPLYRCVRNFHFCLKILAAMNELQCNRRYLYGDGVIEYEIIALMKEKYNLDGDLKTQVRISLRQLVVRGLITRDSGRYRLVGPMVRVMRMPSGSFKRYSEIDRVNKVFWPDINISTPTIAKLYNTLKKFWWGSRYVE